MSDVDGVGKFSVEGISADLTNQTFDKEGNLVLTFTIARESKWKAAPLTDIRGRAFTLNIETQGSRVFLAPGALEAARQRVQEALDNGE